MTAVTIHIICTAVMALSMLAIIGIFRSEKSSQRDTFHYPGGSIDLNEILLYRYANANDLIVQLHSKNSVTLTGKYAVQFFNVISARNPQ